MGNGWQIRYLNRKCADEQLLLDFTYVVARKMYNTKLNRVSMFIITTTDAHEVLQN